MATLLYRNEFTQDVILGPFANASVTGDTAIRVLTVPTGRKLRITGAKHYNPTGLATSATDYFVIEVLKNATVAASFSTLTGADGTIAAGADVTLNLSATDANLVLDAGDTLSVNLNETGTATLPAGQTVIFARWVQ